MARPIKADQNAEQDITERKRGEEALRAANAQLVESDRRKDEFLAILAHELRNPLAGRMPRVLTSTS